MERLSSHVQDLLLHPDNSWIEVLDQFDEVKALNDSDINRNLDMFYVISGQIKFTMRQDTLHHVHN